MHDMRMTNSKVENSAQVLSRKLRFVHVCAFEKFHLRLWIFVLDLHKIVQEFCSFLVNKIEQKLFWSYFKLILG
jgi:hypothetical protein